ncbi:hypothetical protein MLD38_009772 [Melastoma candidum]|uniref:Uncharacterized protein n=1 Tax=Melastoma candidum TaxID=119954 RepID=A0ACB9RYB2_9MYRT|nr:hypothetical protein MLD38_009772 [Melastoma candidum]
MDCGVCLAKAGEDIMSMWKVGEIAGGSNMSSVESEHDLAFLVSDFLENGGGSCGAEPSWCSSDSDSGFCDLPYLASKISLHKNKLDQYEIHLQSVVHSHLLSMNGIDLQSYKFGPCYGSGLRFCLVDLLRRSGYDAAVCSSRWPGDGKVPGGDHEFVDVINHTGLGTSERLIIEMDFRSHFEIARAVDSYDRILHLLPVVYIGPLSRLNHYLQVMADAARFSLKQNSMPLPPWRSLSYLQAKWNSPCERRFYAEKEDKIFVDHEQCSGLLKRLQSALALELGVERPMKPVNFDTKNRKPKQERRKHSLLRNSSD